MLMTMIKLFNIGFTQKTAEQFWNTKSKQD